MKRRRFLQLSVLAVPARALAQANAHVSTTDPLVVAITRGKDVMPGKVRLEFVLPAFLSLFAGKIEGLLKSKGTELLEDKSPRKG